MQPMLLHLRHLLPVILFSLCCYCSTAQASANQGGDTKVSITGGRTTLRDVFRSIKKQTGMYVMYSVGASQISQDEIVSMNFKETRLDDLFEYLFKGKNLQWKYNNNVIVISAKEGRGTPKNDNDSSITSIAVSGTVTDAKGTPLARATIVVKGTGDGTTTDEAGKFTLSKISRDAVLVVTSVGFEPREIAVRGKSILVQLNVDVNELDETVVMAYGTTTKRYNTGNITTIKAETIAKQPVANPLQAIQGRVPGLVISQNTGMPGGGFSVQIRGQNSITNGNDPFYVIDGIPYSSQTLGTINGALRGGNPLNFINPSDIESIEVLKDADATSIYGSRAANGAILITTKKGKPGATRLDVNIYSGIGKVTRRMDLLNSQQYLEMRHEAFKNDGVATLPANAYDLNGVWDTTRYTDWQKVLLGNTAHYTDAQVSISGGNVNTQFLIGGGYHRETTVFPGAKPDDRYSTHFNLNNKSLDGKFRVALTVNYIIDRNRVELLDLTSQAINLPPVAPALYNADGSLNWAPISPGRAGTWSNPLRNLVVRYKGNTNNLLSNAVIGYTIVKGLDFSVNAGYTNMRTDEITATPSTINDPGNPPITGSSKFNNTAVSSWIIEPQANYRLQVGRGYLTALLGATFQQSSNDGETFSARGYTSDALLENIKAAGSLTTESVLATLYRYNAFFGRIHYNVSDKYLLNLTARRDGSSRFGPDKQFANFGAIGAAWIFSNEDFIKRNLMFLSFGKLRGSYGTSGNDQVGDYRFLDVYSNTQYNYQGMQGLYPGNLFNPDLAWEVNKKIEVGIELGFLKDRILLNASYFRNRSSNQLVTTPLSAMTGFQDIASNLPALVQNTGSEIVLNTQNIVNKNFEWTTSFNISIPKNKLIEFPDIENSSYNYGYKVGQPITSIKVFHLVGVSSETGIYQFSDSKGGLTSAPSSRNDRIRAINLMPKYYGGIENSLRYKNISLTFFIQFVKQSGKNIWGAYSQIPGMRANMPTEVLNRWPSQGDKSIYQKFTQQYADAADAYNYALDISDFVYGDASFIRMKNISFSWQLPEKLKTRMRIQNARVYFQAQNVFTITNYLGMDPETQGAVIPPLRVLSVGVQLGL